MTLAVPTAGTPVSSGVWGAAVTDLYNDLITGDFSMAGGLTIGSDLAVGDDVTIAGDLTVSGIGQVLYKRKTLDETINNVGVLQNDDELSVSLPSLAGSWEFWLHAIYNSGVTPDFQFSFTLPSGATMAQNTFICGGSGSAIQHGALSSGGTGGVDGLGADAALDFWGTLVGTGTGGPVTFRWAQQTATVANTIVRAGSSLRFWRMP